MTGVFPSPEHRAELVTQSKGYGLTDGEKEQYYAYDYGWRRVMRGNFARTSVIDPEGVWFRPQRVEDAERMYRQKFARPKPKDTLVEPRAEASAEEVEAWEQGRRELAVLKSMITGTGKLHDGSPTPEAVAFVEACSAFRVRLAAFVPSHQRVAGPRLEPRLVEDERLERLQRGMGLNAVEREDLRAEHAAAVEAADDGISANPPPLREGEVSDEDYDWASDPPLPPEFDEAAQ